MRLYKLTQAEIEEVLDSGERLNQGNKLESRQGKLRVIWVDISPYIFVVTVIRTR